MEKASIESTVNIDGILDKLGYPQNPNLPAVEGQTFVAPLSSRGLVPTAMSKYSRPTTANNNIQIPSTWDWRNVKDEKTNKSIIRGAGTQYGCGACFLLGIISMMEDRLTILSKREGPYLSYTFVLSCNKESGACAGGNPFQAAEFIAANGTVDYICSDFSFCIFNPGCAQGTNSSSQNNQLIPSCESQRKCQTCYENQCLDVSNLVFRQLFYIDSNSIHELANIADIQKNVMQYGPCAVTFRVPLDFILGGISQTKYTKATQWSQTNGIYINIENVDMYDMKTLDNVLVADTFMGNHTIVIVGWSSEEIVDPNINNGARTVVFFWIVRNSWSESWNAPMLGFCKIAMTNPSLKINTRLFLDTSTSIDGIHFGGGVSILPSEETLKRITDQTRTPLLNFNVTDASATNNQQHNSNGSFSLTTTFNNVSANGSRNTTIDGNKMNEQQIIWTSVGIASALVLILTVVLIIFFTTRRYKSR